MSERDNDSRDTGVHRLVDMVVEEVSLVDRAANKRRYLLVKRSEDVADNDSTETETDTDTDDTNTETDTSETDDDETEDGDGSYDDDDDDKKPSSSDAVATTAAVVAALEAMSAAVETLATAQAKAAPPKKKPPARGGGSTAAENDDDDDETEEDDEWEEDEEKAPPARRPKGAPKRQAKGDDAFAQMKAAIGLLEGLVGGKSRQAKRARASIDDVATKLDAVTTTLSDLKKLVGGQGERIGRVEKSVGLPASRPVEGKGKKKGDSDAVSWPFDLNTSVDRASVDKSVSFHD